MSIRPLSNWIVIRLVLCTVFILGMKRLLLIASVLMLCSVGFGVNLNVDASKKKSPRIIKPESFKTKQNSKFQNKRYTTGELKDSPVLHKDSQVSYSTKKPSETIDRSNGKMSRMGESASQKTPRILDQIVTSSVEFEEAYRKALAVELSKRAATQVEVTKTKANLKQRDINRDAKVRRSKEDGFKVQSAGSDGD